jgi:hypothetical protein
MAAAAKVYTEPLVNAEIAGAVALVNVEPETIPTCVLILVPAPDVTGVIISVITPVVPVTVVVAEIAPVTVNPALNVPASATVTLASIDTKSFIIGSISPDITGRALLEGVTPLNTDVLVIFVAVVDIYLISLYC